MHAAQDSDTEAEACFLGVSSSYTGKRWLARQGDSRLALALAQQLQVPEMVARVLAGRGITLEQADSFLNPSLRESLPDPSEFQDMDKAAERVAAAVMGGETVAIFGDYDVDGATSSALLDRFLRQAGAKPLVYIPDRIAEGYGPNAAALEKLRAAGAGMVITVDCGTTAHEPLASAAAKGLDVVVVDHHVAEPSLPTAYAVVNPNRLDDDCGYGQLAAVGVTFLLCVAVNRLLRQAGWFGEGRREPDLLRLVDLVALGTVCDVVPLTGVNRVFVAQGLRVMASRANAGISALADVARVDERLSAYHLGFVLGPRVNAGGRVGRADLGARILASDDPTQAEQMARELDGYNVERKALEDAVLQQALAQAEAAQPHGIVAVAGRG
ncbi:MAG: DHH family phosphoesterase, partial [Rhodovibrionaceae bacterium]|nr:DHH family phosphoesterase [Rhodovibrionaceae bacterium]